MILVSLHMMAAKAFDMDALSLDAEEARRIATALAKVGEHYHYEASAETLLWVNLSAALASVYGPRAMMLVRRHADKKYNAKRVIATQPPAPVQSAGQAAAEVAGNAPAPQFKPNDLDPNLFAHASSAG